MLFRSAGRVPDAHRVSTVMNWPRPKDIHDIRAFLGEELMLALITDRRSRLRRSGVIRHGLQRSNVDPMPSGADTNGHATASLTYATLVKGAYAQVPRGRTKTRNSSVPPPTLPTGRETLSESPATHPVNGQFNGARSSAIMVRRTLFLDPVKGVGCLVAAFAQWYYALRFFPFIASCSPSLRMPHDSFVTFMRL